MRHPRPPATPDATVHGPAPKRQDRAPTTGRTTAPKWQHWQWSIRQSFRPPWTQDPDHQTESSDPTRQVGPRADWRRRPAGESDPRQEQTGRRRTVHQAKVCSVHPIQGPVAIEAASPTNPPGPAPKDAPPPVGYGPPSFFLTKETAPGFGPKPPRFGDDRPTSEGRCSR